MLSKCMGCDCGPMCSEHCLAFKCFACDTATLSEPSCCENTGSLLIAVPFTLLSCACSVWKMFGCTSGCACYCPCSAFGLGCIAPHCPGCYCIKMTPEEKKYWAGKQPFEGGTAASRAPTVRASKRGKEPALVAGAGSSSSAVTRKPSKAELKAEAKRKKEEEAAAKLQENRSAWGAMVDAQGGANAM